MKTLLSRCLSGPSFQKPVLLLVMFFLTASLAVLAQSPVDANGALRVSGSQLVNANGDPVQLRGMSTHGPQWYSSCINFNSINAMVNDWGIDVLRLAMYVEEEGYVTNSEYWKSWIDEVVDIAGQHGVYCLIDWHVHKPGDPWANIDAARDFWNYMSAKHAGKAHVIYEICNEPNGVDWSRVKSYAEEIIPIIRNNDPESVIIVGTPNWSQDVDAAAANPLNFENIMYALHFYSGSHGASLRQKAETAMNAGAAVFVTEWGTSMATGDGGPYFPESDVWVNWMHENKLSWCNWSYADKEEISAALEPGSCLSYQWNNTSPSGTYVKNALLTPADAWSGTGGNIKPVASITLPVGGGIFELGEDVLMEATASDADGTVVLVEFFANGQKVGEATSAPFSLVWQATAVGDYLLVAKATDNAGDTGSSSPVAVSVLAEIIQYAYPDGIPHAVPGIVEGVHFDVGGEGIAYH
ncbi:MAG: cellulase family glycosylhydrolase, partial [Bacteroidales bacterium]|nr:cellulase family glycosylhydrolase [Bacteroidales bacterium]